MLLLHYQIKHNESLKYHAEILRLRELLDQPQNQQLEQCQSSKQEGVELKNDDISVGDSWKKSQEEGLEAKCASLAASLQQERTQNTYLQNEVILKSSIKDLCAIFSCV